VKLKKSAFGALAVAALVGSSLAIGATAASAEPVTKVTICHRTNSDSNPYVVITPDVSGVLDGHDKKHNEPFVWGPTLKAQHQKWGDIIPAFDYIDKGGNLQHFDGLNLDTLGGTDGKTPGSAILENNCQIPGPPPVEKFGDLTVTKQIVGTPTGSPSFTVHVECDDDSVNEDVVFTTNGESKTYLDLAEGITCFVEETNTGGATATYTPLDVSSSGIEIVADTDNAVTVTNTFPAGPDIAPEVVTTAPAAVAPAAVAATPRTTG